MDARRYRDVLDAARVKTVEMDSDFDYVPDRRVSWRFEAGVTYRRVLEAAAREIERAGAGRIIPHATGSHIVDANAFKRRG